MLEVQGLTVKYGGIQAVSEVSFKVERGEIVSVIGSNGAGKSTILKAIAGLVRSQSGVIRFEGRPITDAPAHKVVPLGISLVPEGRKIFPDQTIWDNLMLGGYVRRKDDLRADAEVQLDRFPILRERRNQSAGSPQRRTTTDACDLAGGDGSA